jgi:hypothetical protein
VLDISEIVAARLAPGAGRGTQANEGLALAGD